MTKSVDGGLCASDILNTENPLEYLQDLIVFASSGLAGCFLVPVAFALFWPRMNGAGAVAGMLGGGGTHLLLYIVGYLKAGHFSVHPFLGLNPFIWEVAGSAICLLTASLLTAPPAESLVRKFFGRKG